MKDNRRIVPPLPIRGPGTVRKCDLDDRRGIHLPIPTRIVSNEEYAPPPQFEEQRRVERTLVEAADRLAPRLGLDRRQFLRTSCGMARRTS